jgi:hypothetical protein
VVAAKKYEKDRRIRFNALLDRLASVLPDCPVGNPDNKWTKAQVIFGYIIPNRIAVK